MNKCPPELHAYICQLACIDDGPTVRSINKTSRYFYEISKPYLFQTLSISGPKQIHAIAALLETTPKSHLRQIRHLFISDTTCATARSHEPDAMNQATPDTPTLIVRIISLTAPTLQSLAFVAQFPQTSTYLIAGLFRTSFPRLRDLTISGFYPFPTTPGKFPQLERLHLSGNRNPHGLLETSALENACPSLKSLKVSGLGLAASFVMEVKEAVKNNEKQEEAPISLFPAKFPVLVRQVTLQAGPAPKIANGGKEGNIQLKDRLMMKGLEELNKGATSNLNEVQIIVLERSARPTVRIIRDIKREWLENISTFEP